MVIPEHITLSRLHDVIQAAMGWTKPSCPSKAGGTNSLSSGISAVAGTAACPPT
ncbi:hypothetical protein [Cupriavidus taiwanensis]|uniref:hypothetical protein n=1 Tax=Cupriavidus taiwanensis TaxID=164546 RepID=UPI0032ECE27D